ncbi:MAG: bis(5'-nucleosyl)-tetraphosphatase (symmetrical) YqeK [Treponema sp.]
MKNKSNAEAKNEIETLIKNIDRYAQTALSVPRYKHSVRVAELAEKMCALYGLCNVRRGYLAGVAHDICKEEDDETLLSYAVRDGNPVSVLEAERPALLHGRAAAVMLREKFGITDSDILEAVSIHTFGKKGCANLSKILFAADKIEPGRNHVTDAYLSQKLSLPLDALVKSVIQENVDYLKTKGKVVSSVTMDFLSSL